MKRSLLMLLVVVLGLSACSSESSLSEYAEKLETLVNSMNRQLDEGDEALPPDPTLEEMRTYAQDRIAVRTEFLDAFRGLGPHVGVEDLYTSALDTITRLTEAEQGLLDFVMAAETAEEAAGAWDSPAGATARAIDQESLAICAAAQAKLDETQAREEFSDVPWIPPEMKEVISVAFRCDRSER